MSQFFDDVDTTPVCAFPWAGPIYYDAIWVFDNRRVLHGRRAIAKQGGGLHRALEGCYMEWDDLEGLARVLPGGAS